MFYLTGEDFFLQNARSLLPKLEEIKHLTVISKATGIAVSMTWLDSSIQDAETSSTGVIATEMEVGYVCLSLFLASECEKISLLDIDLVDQRNQSPTFMLML